VLLIRNGPDPVPDPDPTLKLGLDTFISTFSKFFLFSSLQIVSSSEHNSENEVKQNKKGTANWNQKIIAEMINYFTIFYWFTI
jgi:hypothetical protein